MALEKEIIARIHDAIDSGHPEQEKLYRALLGDLTFRETQGLRDTKRLLSKNFLIRQYSSEDEYPLGKEGRVIAEDINMKIGSKLDDSLRIVRLYRPPYMKIDTSWPTLDPEWENFRDQLPVSVRRLLGLCFGSIYNTQKPLLETVGEVRNTTTENLTRLRNMGPKRALFIATVLTAPNDSAS